MLPEFLSVARVSEYVWDLEYLFSRMNVGSYGATEPHMWLVSKIPQCTWDDCRATSERKSRTHSYNELVDLLVELALERENDSHVETFLRKHFGRGGTPTPKCGEGKGPREPTNATQGGGKRRGKLRAMNEVKPDAGRDADSQRIQFGFAEFAANSFAARICCEFSLKFTVLRIRGEFPLRIRGRRQNGHACAVFSPDEKLTLNCAMQ